MGPVVDMEQVAKRLARTLATPPAHAPRPEPLAEASAPARVAAVDGSHVLLAGARDPILVAWRAGSVLLVDGRPVQRPAPALRLAHLTRADARETVARALEAHGASSDALPLIEPGAALEALRAIAELAEAERVLAELGGGDLLLIDGALQARVGAALLDRTLALAARRGVEVVGVCKSTSLLLDGAPALAACQLAGRALGARPWSAPLPTPPSVRGASFAARLSRAEERVFRFDVASGAPGVLAALTALAGHPAYPGYPSPLAMAHHAVVIQEEERRRLLAQVEEAALAAGADPRAWETAFADYHDVLEMGA